jgi:hypothetical protein
MSTFIFGLFVYIFFDAYFSETAKPNPNAKPDFQCFRDCPEVLNQRNFR